MKIECRTCRDVGTIGGCPKCGKHKQLGGEKKSDSEIAEEIGTKSIPKPRELFLGSSLLIHKISESNQSALKQYADALDKIIESAKTGIIPQKSILIVSPSGFAKSVFLTTLRYHYAISGVKMAKVRTLEEFAINYSNVLLRKDKGLYFLENIVDSDIVLLNVMSPTSTSLKNNVRDVLNLVEDYGKPVIILASTNTQSILYDTSILNDKSLSFRNPSLIAYN